MFLVVVNVYHRKKIAGFSNISECGVKQELSESEFSSSIEKLKDNIIVKFCDINARLDEIEKNIKKSVAEKVNGSIMSIKNTIIDGLKEENLKLQNIS